MRRLMFRTHLPPPNFPLWKSHAVLQMQIDEDSGFTQEHGHDPRAQQTCSMRKKLILVRFDSMSTDRQAAKNSWQQPTRADVKGP